MKVFIPMSDATMGENGEVDHSLVPFDPAFLGDQKEELSGHKPDNWINECTYEMARERLFAT